MPNSVESILAVFLMSLGDVGFIWEGVSNTNHEIIGKIHFFIFIAIVVILLLNLLIAMMGDTYAKIAEIKNEWMRQVRTTSSECKLLIQISLVFLVGKNCFDCGERNTTCRET